MTFHDCGSLRLAYTDDELDWLRYTPSIGRALEHPMDIIGPDAIRERHPFYDLDGVKAALWTPEDGHVDPAGATFALAAGARQAGARIVRGNRITGIARAPGGEWRVSTEQGDSCASTWSTRAAPVRARSASGPACRCRSRA